MISGTGRKLIQRARRRRGPRRARRQLAAERSRQPIRQLSLQYPRKTATDAYRVQRALVAATLAEGQIIRARIIGLTSRAMQQALSISEPDHGVIFDDMVFADSGLVPFGRFIRPTASPGWRTSSRPTTSSSRPVFVADGDVIHADFGDLGAVTCRFR